jgi:tellurite resistance protein
VLDPGPDFVPQLRRDQLEALVETMYLVAFADGELGAAEREHFARSVAQLTGGRMAGDELGHVLARLPRALGSGRDGLVASIKRRLPAHLRQLALVLAADMAAADGYLHPNERRLLLILAQSFGISDAEAREVVEGPSGA